MMNELLFVQKTTFFPQDVSRDTKNRECCFDKSAEKILIEGLHFFDHSGKK